MVAFLAKRDDAAALKEYASFEDRFEVAFIAKRAAEARAAEEAEAERMRELVAAQVGGDRVFTFVFLSFTFLIYHLSTFISSLSLISHI